MTLRLLILPGHVRCMFRLCRLSNYPQPLLSHRSYTGPFCHCLCLPSSLPTLQPEAFSKASLLYSCCSNPSAGMGTRDSDKPLVGTAHSSTALQAARGDFQSKMYLYLLQRLHSQDLQCKHMPTRGGSCAKTHTSIIHNSPDWAPTQVSV